MAISFAPNPGQLRLPLLPPLPLFQAGSETRGLMGGGGGGVFQGMGEGAPGRSAERLSTPIWVELLCRLGVGGCQGEWIPPKDRFRKEGWALGVVRGL